MNAIGVITGDVVQSTQITEISERKLLANSIKDIISQINENTASREVQVEGEIFRGDSFQIIVKNIKDALRVSILVRAGLQAHSPGKDKWDARLVLGIGQGEFQLDNIVESDGEAFRNSGREFDELTKPKRMAIRTPWDDMNDEFRVSTAFADALITNWTITQATVIYAHLLRQTSQKMLAKELDRSPQNISKVLTSGRFDLIEMYLERYQQLISLKR